MADPIENIKRRVEYQNKKSSISADSSLLEFGKLPPQAKELEEAVLGALMIEKNAMDEVAEILKEESFYVEAHQYIFPCYQTVVCQSKSD
jgi:replicative DNA helicase